jgi:hypothetical protein
MYHDLKQTPQTLRIGFAVFVYKHIIAAVAAFIQRASSGIFILRILHLRVKI